MGCKNLAHLYHGGLGVEKDITLSAQYLDKACSLGGANQCKSLGRMFEKGKDVVKDISLAREYYKKACDLNPKVGCEAYERLKNQ